MQVTVVAGDVLDEQVDVLICTANVQLNLSGGVNGALLLRGGAEIQRELHDFLQSGGRSHVPPGTVVRSSPGPLAVRHILHVVAVDAFYGSSVEQVQAAIENSLQAAAELEARTVAMPSLGTGYGPLSYADFAQALRAACRRTFEPIEELRVVLRRAESAAEVRRVLDES